MATNKNKQNLRYKKVSARLNKKVRFDGLSNDEIKYIKTKIEYEQVQKDLNYFWNTAPRKNNVVNWDKLTESELDYFDYIYQKSEKLLKKISSISDKINVEETESIFLQLNCNSVSF